MGSVSNRFLHILLEKDLFLKTLSEIYFDHFFRFIVKWLLHYASFYLHSNHLKSRAAVCLPHIYSPFVWQ